MSQENLNLGYSVNAIDTLNKTFNETTHQWFLSNTLNMTSCPATSTFVNDSYQTWAAATTNFQEVILHDNTNTVFASILAVDADGYKSEDNVSTFDFQMIVAQSANTTDPTPYYFWVELNG